MIESSEWAAVVLAALNVFQAIALAWLGARQEQAKRKLDETNGEQAAAIAELRRELERRPRL